MKIIHVISALETEAAGISYSVPRLSSALQSEGVDSSLATTINARRQSTTLASFQSVQYFPVDLQGVPIAQRLRLSNALARFLDAEAQAGSIIHSHGLWLAPDIYSGLVAARRRSIVVHSPHGMLGTAALEFSKVKKSISWAIAQGRAIRAAKVLHATSRDEADDIRRAGLTAPIAVIPNGIDIPPADHEANARRLSSSQRRRQVLHLGRLHPKKGTDRLIAAWSMLEADFPDWDLQITGPSEVGYAEKLKRQATAAGLRNVKFGHAVFGPDKIKAYQSADVFALPTLNENFGLVVAEALAVGTPVICSKGAPWSGLVDEACGWWVDPDPHAFASAMRSSMEMSDKARYTMGQRGRAWVTRDFSWRKIARDMADVYRWVSGTGDRPTHVVP